MGIANIKLWESFKEGSDGKGFYGSIWNSEWLGKAALSLEPGVNCNCDPMVLRGLSFPIEAGKWNSEPLAGLSPTSVIC